MLKRSVRLFTRAIAAVLLALSVWPQASTGTVRDETAALVPHVAVRVTNIATGVASKATGNDVGFYIFPGVVAGRYTLAVEAPGMQKYEATLAVQVLQDAVVDPVLRAGQATSQVVVRDVTPIVTTSSPDLGHVLYSRA